MHLPLNLLGTQLAIFKKKPFPKKPLIKNIESKNTYLSCAINKYSLARMQGDAKNHSPMFAAIAQIFAESR